jgi:hypothetical protein
VAWQSGQTSLGGAANAGGSGGQAAAGAAGRTGGAAGGQATGSPAAGGSGGVGCPSAPPAAGDVCAPNGLECAWGSGGAATTCACADVWWCNANCPAEQPTPGVSCAGQTNQACSYGEIGCACMNLVTGPVWMCLGSTGCPSSPPTSATSCTGSEGLTYPYSVQAGAAQTCICAALVAGIATWTCMATTACPASAPETGDACNGQSVCTYGAGASAQRCVCSGVGSAWVCF